jgi:hypothetical protein
MNAIKILYLNGERYSDEIFCKNFSELRPWEKEEIVLKCLNGLTNESSVNILNQLYAYIDQKVFHKYVKSQGYDLISKIKDSSEIEVKEPNTLYYTTRNGIHHLNPSIKDGYYYDEALKHEGTFFVKVNVPEKHPLIQARLRYQKKQEQVKVEKAEKRKAKQIEKAKKILQENQ